MPNSTGCRTVGRDASLAIEHLRNGSSNSTPRLHSSSKLNHVTFNHGVEGSSPSALTKKSLSRRHFLNYSKCRLGCAQLQIRIGLHLDCTADDDPNPGQDLIHGWRKQNGPRPPVHPERTRPVLRHRQILPPRFGAQRTSCRVYTCAGPRESSWCKLCSRERRAE